jgi:two-component system response regulator NreC
MAIRILLADDHKIVRQGLRSLLLEKEGFQVVGEGADGQEAVRLARTLCPDVAILDIGMPILNGIDAAKEIARVSPRTRTIVLTMHDDEGFVLKSLRAGVRGYLLKSRAAEDLVQAIGEVSRGEVYLSPGISETVVNAFLNAIEPPQEPLSDRERQVLQLVAEGKRTKEIAQILCVSTSTAESHRNHIMRKLDIHEIAGLVHYAIEHGLVVVNSLASARSCISHSQVEHAFSPA